MKKRILSVFITFAIVFTMFTVTNVQAEIYSGRGWSFDSETGTLTVTTNAGTTVWRTGRSASTFVLSTVKAVVVSDVVTSIGESAFRDCTRLTEITIVTDVKPVELNAPSPIFITLSGIVIVVRLVQPLNTLPSIKSTPLGIVTEVKLVVPRIQPELADCVDTAVVNENLPRLQSGRHVAQTRFDVIVSHSHKKFILAPQQHVETARDIQS